MRRKRPRKQQRLSRFRAGVIGIVALALLAYGAYTKFANPFASKFTVHALFSSANGLGPDSLVRIAGVNVGRVTAVSTVPGCKLGGTQTSQCQAANVTMEIDPQGLPLHAGRDVRDPAPHLPRGQLLRRRRSREPVGPDDQDRAHVPDHPGNRARPARSGPGLARGQHAEEPAAAAEGVRHRRQQGRVRLQRVDQVLATGIRVLGDRRP